MTGGPKKARLHWEMFAETVWRHNAEVKEVCSNAQICWKCEGVVEDNKDYNEADMGLSPQLFIRQSAFLKYKVILF